ncbi:MAG TPA: histidine kinase dimerization/phospho-acceptor domain-containing protein, partial [Stellaceae bacterium]|nr:histidine kinase dimerization/phospho-acceptor domain-containing protein [Stellaceae bacterium]
MRAALLTSISHDLRTPLTSIIGTVSSLKSYADKYGPAERDELLTTLEREFGLLRHLVAHAGKVLTHRHLLREVWGPAQEHEVQYLRVFIRGLRQ